MMIDKGRIHKHEVGEPSAFSTQDNKMKGRGGPSNTRNSTQTPRDSKRKTRREKEMSKIECYNCHKFGHYAQDCWENRNAPRSRYNKNRSLHNSKFNNRRRDNLRIRDDRRRRDAPYDCDENHRSQKKSRNSRYEINAAASQFECILISSLSSSSPPYSYDSWLVDSGASRHFSKYKEVLSNLVEREISLKIILGDNSTYPVKGFSSMKFDLEFGEFILIHEVMYVLELKKNLVSTSTLENKGMRLSLIRGKFLTWSMES